MTTTEQHWNVIPDAAAVAATAEALRRNGLEVHVVPDGAAAKAKALEIIPPGAEVMTMTSVTLQQAGLAAAINDGSIYRSVRRLLETMDTATHGREKRQLGAAPDWAVGSVHAVTKDGRLLVASNSGSQLPAYAYGAANVLWVAGTHKIVSDLAMGMRRVEEYCLPLESERAKKAYGVAGSAISKLLVFNREPKPGRTTIILVGEALGY